MATLWIARWRNNSLHIYTEKPTRDDGYGEFWLLDGNVNENSMHLDCDIFPEVTYENSPVEVSLQKALGLKEALKELERIAQEALNNIEEAAIKYADGRLPDSPYSQNTMRKQTLYEWGDLAAAFEAGVRWVANKHNITF